MVPPSLLLLLPCGYAGMRPWRQPPRPRLPRRICGLHVPRPALTAASCTALYCRQDPGQVHDRRHAAARVPGGARPGLLQVWARWCALCWQAGGGRWSPAFGCHAAAPQPPCHTPHPTTPLSLPSPHPFPTPLPPLTTPFSHPYPSPHHTLSPPPSLPPTPCSCMMVDEAHERTLHTDVLFGLVKDIARFRWGALRRGGAALRWRCAEVAQRWRSAPGCCRHRLPSAPRPFTQPPTPTPHTRTPYTHHLPAAHLTVPSERLPSGSPPRTHAGPTSSCSSPAPPWTPRNSQSTLTLRPSSGVCR